jgi:hypothetical protein
MDFISTYQVFDVFSRLRYDRRFCSIERASFGQTILSYPEVSASQEFISVMAAFRFCSVMASLF